ncbi:hypothetical protein, partial [Klebsiella pneumoniae]|uniref:hypothetical protein n=1 Tax=Klebsiella pneumoniae TaxID=573 RepID=UPI001C12BEF9
KIVLEVFLREWSKKKATPATALTVRGCDHVEEFEFGHENTGDMAMITLQMSHRPAWGGVHAKS